MSMPWWMQVYTILFIIVLISNLIFQLKHKTKKFILLYEFFSAGYMVFLIYAYWTPTLLHNFSILNLIALPFVIGFDFYLTMWGNEEQLGINIHGMSKNEFEAAKTVSIVFASPAYITGILLTCHVIMTY